jgi:hypothetical protein
MKSTSLALATLTAAALVACGGGGGGNPAATQSVTLVSGKAMDGYLEKATVFLDLNDNGIFDAGEPYSETGSDGSYTFNVTPNELATQHAIVAIAKAGVTIDKDNPNTTISSSYSLTAPVGKTETLSPITTLIAARVSAGLSTSAAEAAVTSDLGFTANDGINLYKDYITEKLSNPDYQKVHNLAAATTESLKNVEQNGSNDVKQKLASVITSFNTNVANKISAIKSATNTSEAASIASRSGGGGSSSSANSGNDLFSQTAELLPSLKSKYDQLCGNRTSLNAVAVDINKDGRKDLIAQLYCMHLPEGETFTGTVMNNLLVLVQNKDGTFSDQTQSVLGSSAPSADGKVQDFVRYDFNGDGYEDVILTMDGEDGRAPSDSSASNIKFQTVALMSNGDGTYKQIKFGANVWGSDLRLVNNTSGSPLLIVLPADNGKQGWTYNGGWTKNDGYDWVSTYSNVFIDPTAPDNFSTIAFNATKDSSGQYVQVWKRTGNSWAQSTSSTLFNLQQKTFSDNGNRYLLGQISGKAFINPFLYDGCSFKLNKTSTPIPLFAMLGTEITGGFTNEKIVNEPKDSASWGQVNLVTLGLDSNLNIINPRIIGTAELSINYYHIGCQDINADGLQDVFIRNLGNPILMLNDGSDGFKQIKSSAIPSNPNSSRYTYLYEDMDGDGVKDLIYIPLGGQSTFDTNWSYNGFQIKMYKGLRQPSLNDTN